MDRRRTRVLAIVAVMTLCAASALAQSAASDTAGPAVAPRDPDEAAFWGFFDRDFGKHPVLPWSLAPKELGLFTVQDNQLLVPDGFKPGEARLPAVVLVPTCGGTQASTRDRAKEFLAAGYAVLTVESYKPRNTPSCRTGVVTPFVVLKDTHDALAALQAVPWIQHDRIFQVGYSMGAFASAWVSSPGNTANTRTSLRYRASVGHYGSCAYLHAPQSTLLRFLRADVDRPVLMLMAKDDAEAPSERCFPLLDELKVAGKPVSWHLYPDATHAWDRAEIHGYSFTNGFGRLVSYRYDRATTQDATRRTLEFLAQFK